MNYDLIGIGNALVDIEVLVHDSFIDEISVTKGGMTLTSVEDQNKILESLQSNPKKNFFGRFCCEYGAWSQPSRCKILLSR